MIAFYLATILFPVAFASQELWLSDAALNNPFVESLLQYLFRISVAASTALLYLFAAWTVFSGRHPATRFMAAVALLIVPALAYHVLYISGQWHFNSGNLLAHWSGRLAIFSGSFVVFYFAYKSSWSVAKFAADSHSPSLRRVSLIDLLGAVFLASLVLATQYYEFRNSARDVFAISMVELASQAIARPTAFVVLIWATLQPRFQLIWFVSSAVTFFTVVAAELTFMALQNVAPFPAFFFQDAVKRSALLYCTVALSLGLVRMAGYGLTRETDSSHSAPRSVGSS